MSVSLVADDQGMVVAEVDIAVDSFRCRWLRRRDTGCGCRAGWRDDNEVERGSIAPVVDCDDVDRRFAGSDLQFVAEDAVGVQRLGLLVDLEAEQPLDTEPGDEEEQLHFQNAVG